MTQTISQTEQGNPLGYEKLPVLLKSYAIPSIIAMLVSSLYNIVDQIFIGQGVGYLGNAATNVSYPLTTICLAIALLIGIGSASCFSLELGAGREEQAARTVGNAVSMMVFMGILYVVAVEWFLTPLDSIWSYSGDYAVCGELHPHYSSRYASADSHQWTQQPGQGRWKSEIFHDLHGSGSCY